MSGAGDDAPRADSGESEERRGWLRRLTSGLGRSSQRLTSGISAALTRKKLDDEAIEEIEEALIAADLGVPVAARLAGELRRARFGRDVTDLEVRGFLADQIAEMMEGFAQPLVIDPRHRPHVVLVVGVNGSGKTTTIGKLALYYARRGKRVMVAAGDTFRAAAVEQLRIWSDRAGVRCVTRPQGSDPAALAFDALVEARQADADLLLIDTAGRLHNRADLMAELGKIVRVMQRVEPEAPHDCLLVLDATIGQNVYGQIETFRSIVNVTGLVMTKLDGSAKGGVLVGASERFELPINAVGVGEGAEDLREFSAAAYGRGLLGLRGSE